MMKNWFHDLPVFLHRVRARTARSWVPKMKGCSVFQSTFITRQLRPPAYITLSDALKQQSNTGASKSTLERSLLRATSYKYTCYGHLDVSFTILWYIISQTYLVPGRSHQSTLCIWYISIISKYQWCDAILGGRGKLNHVAYGWEPSAHHETFIINFLFIQLQWAFYFQEQEISIHNKTTEQFFWVNLMLKAILNGLIIKYI